MLGFRLFIIVIMIRNKCISYFIYKDTIVIIVQFEQRKVLIIIYNNDIDIHTRVWWTISVI